MCQGFCSLNSQQVVFTGCESSGPTRRGKALLGTMKTLNANNIFVNKLPRHERVMKLFVEECRGEEKGFWDDLENRGPAVPACLSQQNKAQMGKSCLSGEKGQFCTSSDWHRLV